MIRHLTSLFKPSLVALITLTALTSCKSKDDTIDCFPSRTINVKVDLNLPQFQELAGGFGYVEVSKGFQQSGTRGLIIINYNGQIKAYDKNAPHVCPADNTTLRVNGLKVVNPSDGSEWNLYTGEPLEGNKAGGRPPKTYGSIRVGESEYIIKN